MKKLLLALLLIPGLVSAGEAELSWTPPTQNTDGTALTDLDGYRLYYGLTSGDYPEMIDIGDPTVTTYVVQGLTGGETYYFAATAYNTNNIESDYSNEATKVIEYSIPEPPTGLTVAESNLTAYTIVQSRDNIALLPIGSVEPGTSCDGSQSVKGHYVVPRDSVTFAGSVRPEVVVAQCASLT